MWTRRRFLENLSTVPLVGGLIGARTTAAETASLPVEPALLKGKNYFQELGVRPFINAAGTYTAMTASLMPPEVMEAISTPRSTS